MQGKAGTVKQKFHSLLAICTGSKVGLEAFCWGAAVFVVFDWFDWTVGVWVTPFRALALARDPHFLLQKS